MGGENQQSGWETSSSLIERVRADEQEAWERMCEIYAPLVYGWSRKSRLSEHDSEDIVQDVFRRVATGIKKFQYGGPNTSFRGWLWTITRNSIRNRFNEIEKDPAAAEGGTKAMQRISDAPDWLADAEAAEPELSESEETLLVRRALKLVEQDFSEHVWKAFWQFAIEGRSAKEVAEQFGMKPAAVRQAKFRVLARLKEVMG